MNRRAYRGATRLAFLAAGTEVSVWAALVPFSQARLHLDAAALGFVLLSLGIGSLAAMPLTASLTSRFGCRPVILISGLLACAALPNLALASNALWLSVSLFVFGALIGTLDVAMNIQAVMVEKLHDCALMSGFHGLYSVGGFVGAGAMAGLLKAGAPPLTACLVVGLATAMALALASPHLLRAPVAEKPSGSAFTLPRGPVILIGALCFLLFLAEGAILDWGALLLTRNFALGAEIGALGYATFSGSMMLGRLSGDRVVRRFGRSRVLSLGALCTAAGFFTAVWAPVFAVALFGFLLVGLGASNIVPILFTAAARQTGMPAGWAVSAVTTLGYAGILCGPALIGLVTQVASLPAAFACLGCALISVAAASRSRALTSLELG